MKKSFSEYKKKYSWVAWVSLVIYAGLCAFVIWSACDYYFRYRDINDQLATPPVMAQIFVIFVTVWFVLFTYPQIIMLFCSMLGLIKREKSFIESDRIVRETILSSNPKTAILYVTKDDFIEKAFKTNLYQTYKNIDIFILDDSTNPKYIKQIDDCVNNNPGRFTVIRRNGFGPKNKAGNINNFLSTYLDKYDFIAVMDSDTYITPNFMADGLKFFEYYGDLGVLQTINNCFCNVENHFQDLVATSYSAKRVYWAIEPTMSNLYAITLCTGHSCIYSCEMIKKMGGKFPSMLSEDWVVSIEARIAHLSVYYTPSIISYEEIPPNFVAWKKRMLRWEVGAFEFIHKYFGRILTSKMPFYEKIHVFYRAFNTMISPVYSVLSTILSFAMLYQLPIDANGVRITTTAMPWATWAISLVFMAMSVIAIEGKCVVAKSTLWQTLRSMFGEAFIGSAILPSMFFKTVLFPFYKKKFHVTIKQNQKFRWYDTFKYNWVDIVGWTALFAFIIATLVVCKCWQMALNPFLWITFASFISLFFLPMIGNKYFDKPRHCQGFEVIQNQK